jgi:cytochrome c-type biogenesis protein CcmH/NrfG
MAIQEHPFLRGLALKSTRPTGTRRRGQIFKRALLPWNRRKSVVPALLLFPVLTLMAASQTPTSVQDQIAAHERLAQQYLRQQRPDLAIPEFQKLVALDPGNIEAQSNLGVLLFFRGNYQEAVPQLRAAIDLQPQLWKIRSLLGLAEEHMADLADARKDLEASFPMIVTRQLKIEVGLDLVGLYTGSGELDKAAGLVSQLKTAYPDAPEVLYAAYRTYADLSGESMLSLSLVAPDSAQMHQLLAHEEIRQGNTNAAVDQFRQAIALDPDLPGVHYELAELLNTSQDLVVKKEAEQEYRAALKSNPQDEKSICKLGEIALQTGKVQEANEDFSKAIALRPDDSDAKLDMAKVLIQLNQPAKGQELLEQTVQLDPTNATAHYRLATFYREQGRMDEAKLQLELYQNLRKEKDKLRAVYKDLQIQPSEIKADTADEK